jgi:hypothetical protein
VGFCKRRAIVPIPTESMSHLHSAMQDVGGHTDNVLRTLCDIMFRDVLDNWWFKTGKRRRDKSKRFVRQPIIQSILQLLLERESRTGKPRTGTEDLPAIIWMRSPIIGRRRRAKLVE